MNFSDTRLRDAKLITVVTRGDERGSFARTFCAETFGAAGLATHYPQANHSANVRKGTLRGMHFQRAPHREVKVVRCVKGAIHDVIIDLRRESPTYLHWQGFNLTEENGAMLYVPGGFAHGFQTLVDDTHVIYQVSHPYTPSAEGGVRWNDPAFAVTWPLEPTVLSPKDAAWPDFDKDRGIDI
jgi:dTDP-4-dehydrorhamnose 3,5-epimerase